MKLGQPIDKVYAIFLENILKDFEKWGLNPGSFQLKKRTAINQKPNLMILSFFTASKEYTKTIKNSYHYQPN